ncbi:hypothetical protein [uncultured Porticoccus sp.]|uniref:hypothetical protein n=1 Tax=Porticoccus sp. TaxID=2024853 RepID=UPI0030DB6ACF|tara:strand:- start:9539 stop:10195 length:657 start_codon:yes stop_codon:yes gene_type:complete
MMDNANPVRGGCPWLALLVLPMLLQACTTVSETRNALRTAEVCCDDFAAMSFATIPSINPSDIPVGIELNDRSPVYPFSTGKSYFSAYALGPGQPGSDLLLMFMPDRFNTLNSGTFCPVVTYLNSQYEPIASGDLTIRWVSADKSRTGYWTAAQTVPAAASYLIVHTSDEMLSRQLSIDAVTENQTIMVGYAVATIPVTRSAGYRCLPVGKVNIILLG